MKTVLLLFVISLLYACQQGGPSRDSVVSSDAKEMHAPSREESMSRQDGGTSAPDVTGQYVIRTGNMMIRVKDALTAKGAVDAILPKYKAHIGNEQFDNSDYFSSYHIQIRVPAENLQALVAELEALDGVVTAKSIHAADVSEEYIDIETRLANKRSYLDQYRELLKTARTVEDILKVREQIRVLEEEIESAEGRLNYLKSQIALSTLDLTLHQEKSFVYRPDRKIDFFERLKDSISTGWFGFVNFCLVIIGLWPFWLALFLMVFLVKRMKKNRKPVS